MMYVRTFVSVTLRNVAVWSNVIIIARKEGGAWERIGNAPQALDRGVG